MLLGGKGGYCEWTYTLRIRRFGWLVWLAMLLMSRNESDWVVAEGHPNTASYPKMDIGVPSHTPSTSKHNGMSYLRCLHEKDQRIPLLLLYHSSVKPIVRQDSG